MANTNIVQFNQSKTNIMDDSTYSSSIQNGIPSGLADSSLHNKLFYQLSTVIKALTAFVNDEGFDTQDTDVEVLKENIKNALKSNIYESMTATSSGGGTILNNLVFNVC